ncbi:dnl4p [Saccharomyces arboricola H-6]|uniref:DNA ligase n=1 Tax=Saccharomyces arboricola (strain H-6 / AS 2.3317 / CBS 10644) TaxID=1160507 RepID=J8PWM9_SACAR|nr:dnl4p [Saccharomyces arboricola H-6]
MASALESIPEPQNFAPSPDFKWLCEELFVKIDEVRINGTAGTGKSASFTYYETISNFVKLWRKTVGNNIYPALVLALPYRDRRIYSIKDFVLIRTICSYLKLPKNSTTEQRLKDWKQYVGKGRNLSSLLVEEIAKRRLEPNGKVNTIDDVNGYLDELSKERNTHGRGFKNLIKSKSFMYCLQNMGFVELKYFFDIVLKNRVIGGQEHKFLNCWHPDAQDYLSVVSDLKVVTSKLYNPTVRLKDDDLSIKVGFAFAPQLAKKVNLPYEKICHALRNDFLVEEKMDGERIQIHYMNYGKSIKFFSRRGVDYTYLYGASLSSGTISQYLKFSENVKECVLDGEMVTFDAIRKVILPFGLVKGSAKEALSFNDINSNDFHPLYMVFDLLYLNGTSLTPLPLHQRKKYLSSILKPLKTVIEIIRFSRCYNVEAIKKSLEVAISLGSEGVVLKNYSSTYNVASRNSNWIKVKPEYLEEFGENLDLIIIGRDPGKKDSFMLGLLLLDEQETGQKNQEIPSQILNDASTEQQGIDSKKKVTKVVSFCSIANGISQEEFKEIDRKTRGHWKRTSDFPPPTSILQFGSKIPAEWIEPSESIVLEIKSRSLENTDTNIQRYATSCTLYGGYCRRIRYDKDWKDCYTLADLYENRLTRPNPSHQVGKPQLQLVQKKRKRVLVPDPFHQTREQKPISSIFTGLFFYVLSDYVTNDTGVRITQEELDDTIAKHGGKLIHNVISKRHCIGEVRLISCKNTIECRALIDRGYDILHPNWILDCIAYKRLILIEPSYCFSVSQKLRALAGRRVDCLNDSFENDISDRKLSLLFKTQQKLPTVDGVEMSSELREVPLFLFSNRIVYIPRSKYTLKDEKLLEMKIKLFGGSITDQQSLCNLIIIPYMDPMQRKECIKEVNIQIKEQMKAFDTIPKIPRIVASKWVDRSLIENCQVPEEDFPVVNY